MLESKYHQIYELKIFYPSVNREGKNHTPEPNNFITSLLRDSFERFQWRDPYVFL